MPKKFICAAAVLILALCLISGCSSNDNQSMKSWKDLLKPVGQTQNDSPKQENPASTGSDPNAAVETMQLKLYFVDTANKKLVAEERRVEKTKMVARKALEELIKGPGVQQHGAVFPAGTRLLDINLKAEQQLCVVDFSPEILKVSANQEKLLIYAIANTLGQFPTIKEVTVMVNGTQVKSLAGQVDLTKPVKPNYKI